MPAVPEQRGPHLAAITLVALVVAAVLAFDQWERTLSWPGGMVVSDSFGVFALPLVSSVPALWLRSPRRLPETARSRLAEF